MAKLCRLVLIASATSIAAFPAAAAQVSGLTTFTAGTPAKAAEVNDNFSAVKAAIDDNDVRLTEVESGKQDRITGTCSVGSAVTAVAADGSVTCDKVATAGVVSVAADAFGSRHESSFHTDRCAYNSDAGMGGYFGGSGGYCTAKAAVSLPHGATVTGFSCAVRDSSDYEEIASVSLKRGYFSTTALQDIAYSGASVNAASPGYQMLNGALVDVGDFLTIDNSRYTYTVHVLFTTDTGYNTGGFQNVLHYLSLLGCKISYGYP